MLKLRESNEILFHLSNTDQLTGGLNRMAYGIAVSELSSGSVEDDFVYVSADLNGLKQTNDSLGHMAGDELIDGASKCLCDVLGEYGQVYRIGGDEFAALIHTKGDPIDGILEKLNTLVDEWKGRCVQQLSLSVGYASHDEFPEATMESLIKTADKRMYDAKRAYYQSAGQDRRGCPQGASNLLRFNSLCIARSLPLREPSCAGKQVFSCVSRYRVMASLRGKQLHGGREKERERERERENASLLTRLSNLESASRISYTNKIVHQQTLIRSLP